MARAFQPRPSGSSTNFDSKTSSNAAYVAPTRGQQGNALQIILPMGFVLDGKAGSVVIEANGRAHNIEFTIDPVRRTPSVAIRSEGSAVKTGTRVTVRWPNSPRSPIEDAETNSYDSSCITSGSTRTCR